MKKDDTIKNVRKSLKERYGEIKPEWNLIIQTLDNTLIRYNQVKEQIDKDGVFIASINNKNPLLSTEKDLLATILKLSQKLGITSPWDCAKLNKAESGEGEDDTDDFIEGLTNN